MIYYYPDAPDALSAKKQFLREHHYYAKHCFKNTWGKGYVIFDTNDDINEWYIKNTGKPYSRAINEIGRTYTKQDALQEIESRYGKYIDSILAGRDYVLPILAVGLCKDTLFGSPIFLRFAKSSLEEDIERRFYIHYYKAGCFEIAQYSNLKLREILINTLYHHFYEHYFKK